MQDERQLGETLRHELNALVAELEPPAGLADAAIAHRRVRRRAGAGAAALGGAGAVAAGLVLALGGGAATSSAKSSDLHLAAYRFRLPSGARDVSQASAASCAMGAYVVYPGDGPDPGAGPADQPAVANAVTENGGCVSMLLTGAYTPGASEAPRTFLYPVDTSAVTIDGDTGTVGTYEFLGGEDTTFQGVPVPSGTENTEVSLEIPAGSGQVQELLVAAAGVSQSELESIVASGLQQ